MGKGLRGAKKFPPGTRYLIATMADTTWRMFVPTVGLLLLGLQIDQAYHSLPWGTLIGLIIGSVIAGLLIRKQLNRVTK
jgi:hypothetical protein